MHSFIPDLYSSDLLCLLGNCMFSLPEDEVKLGIGAALVWPEHDGVGLVSIT